MLTRFIEHVKQRKTVALDELAAEFGMKAADAVARLQALEAEGRITGVMDDRGKVGSRVELQGYVVMQRGYVVM